MSAAVVFLSLDKPKHKANPCLWFQFQFLK